MDLVVATELVLEISRLLESWIMRQFALSQIGQITAPPEAMSFHSWIFFLGSLKDFQFSTLSFETGSCLLDYYKGGLV